MIPRLRTAVIALLVAAPASAHAQAARTPPHSPTDTKFMQGMMHHHAQAVTMARFRACSRR